VRKIIFILVVKILCRFSHAMLLSINLYNILAVLCIQDTTVARLYLGAVRSSCMNELIILKIILEFRDFELDKYYYFSLMHQYMLSIQYMHIVCILLT